LTPISGANFLLDTVIVAGYFNADAAIQARLADAVVYVASITVGELYFGAHRSQRVADNTANIQRFISVVPVLYVTSHTATVYGKIKASLLAKGRPIPENDIWIAALAVEHSLYLATRDAHFENIDGLLVAIW